MDYHLPLFLALSDAYLIGYHGYNYRILITAFYISYYNPRFPYYSFGCVFLDITNQVTHLLIYHLIIFPLQQANLLPSDVVASDI